MQLLHGQFQVRVQALELQVQEAQGLYKHAAAELAVQGSPLPAASGGRDDMLTPAKPSLMVAAGGGPPGPPPGPGTSITLDGVPGTPKGGRADAPKQPPSARSVPMSRLGTPSSPSKSSPGVQTSKVMEN